MTVVFDLDYSKMASASKDRTSLFDGEFFKITPDVGRKMREWLDRGEAPPNPDDALVERIKAALAKAEDNATLERIIHHKDAIRLADRIADDYDVALNRINPPSTQTDNLEWPTINEEAAE